MEESVLAAMKASQEKKSESFLGKVGRERKTSDLTTNEILLQILSEVRDLKRIALGNPTPDSGNGSSPEEAEV